MSAAFLAALLLAGAAAAQDAGSMGNMNDGGRYGQDTRRQKADRKASRQSSSFIPRDEGSKLYEPPPGAEAAPMPPEPAAAAGPGDAVAPVALTPEDAAENMRTVLETRLAATEGVWKVRDVKTGKRRDLLLQGVSEAKDEGDGRWAGRATFRDKAGTVRARLLVDLSGERWRVLRLEPEGPPAASQKKSPAR